MNKTVNRILAGILVAALVLGLLAGLLVGVNAVAIDYVTGDPTPYSSSDDAYTNVIANWGQRGELATYLSDNAIDFYTAGNTYSDLKDLADTNTATEYNDGLYDALQDLMVDNHVKQTSYGDTRVLYAYTDCQDSDITDLTCFYSGASLNAQWDAGATWNREHTWPKSKTPEGTSVNNSTKGERADIIMLRPAVSAINSSRGDKAYGANATTQYYFPNQDSDGTVDIRGDVARTMLYVYVRWGNTSYMWGADGVIESMDVLLQWLAEDPVDTWELGRNDSVESITGTRNVFVDYPELGFLLFNEEVPDMQTPSGQAAAQNSRYTVTADSADPSWGTVTCSGNTITAFPVRGYAASGWTVTSGSATVTRNGNVFTVNASSDCTVQIHFQPAASHLISFIENVSILPDTRVYEGEYLTMPEHTGSIPAGYTFLGWTQSKVNHSSAKPAQVYAPGDRFVPEDDTLFYALYQYTVDDPSADSDVFEKHTGAVVPGRYLIVSDGAAMSATISSNRFSLDKGITISGTQATGAAATSIWKIEQLSENVFTFYNENTGKYAAGTGAKNKGQMVSTVSDYAKWEIKSTAEPYVVVCVGNRSANVNHTLRRNADYGFAPYAASTGTGITLYKQAGGRLVYTTTEAYQQTRGDMNGDGEVTDADALYLLRYTLFPDRFPITQSGDVNGDSEVTDADALYLLRYTLFPDRFPLV